MQHYASPYIFFQMFVHVVHGESCLASGLHKIAFATSDGLSKTVQTRAEWVSLIALTDRALTRNNDGDASSNGPFHADAGDLLWNILDTHARSCVKQGM